jgi:hypothetical protein
MKATVTVTANDLERIAARLPRALTEIVKETLNEVEADIAVAMGEPKSGREYRRGERWHQASAPGEAPAIDMGMLAASIQQRLDDHGDAGAEGLVYTAVEYAPYLEYGTGSTGASWPLPERPANVNYTTSLVGMAPRPYMTSAAERARPGFETKLRQVEKRL